jgi:hypothetical protein
MMRIDHRIIALVISSPSSPTGIVEPKGKGAGRDANLPFDCK